MKKRLIGTLVAASLFTAFSASAQTAATVNGKAISSAQVTQIVKLLSQRGQAESPELRARVKEDLIMREVLVQEANKKKLGSTPIVKANMDRAQRDILISALMNDFSQKQKTSDTELKKAYEEVTTNMGKEEYRAQHILVKSEDEAKKLIAQLKDGAKFDDLAKQYSQDPGSAKAGGMLGWNVPTQYAKPFGDALKNLKKGDVSQAPVQTQFGYHIIRVDDVRPTKFPGFEEAKPQLREAIVQQKWQEYVTSLRQKAAVK